MSQSTTVTFVNNDVDENPFNFTVQATGIAAPSFGNYANTSIVLGSNTTITPTAAPTNQTYATATTTAEFKGKLEVDPATGVVRVTNAHPANRAAQTYLVTVRAYNVGGATTKTFNLTVTTPASGPLSAWRPSPLPLFPRPLELVRPSEISTPTAGRILFANRI